MIPAAYAVLDLAAAAHNLAQVRRLASNAKIMAVIKANGYGHGMLRVATALQDADAFAVARVDEGVRLRKAGFLQRIAVLEGFTCTEELDDMLQHQLDAVVHDPSQLDIFADYAGSGQIAVWLKQDTGMNRLGFKAEAIVDAYQRLAACPMIRQPINLMTHFANADEPNDAMTARQIACFHATVAGLAGERSMANSAGILAWPAALTDWVRPGVMLYGISPLPDSTGESLGLKPVMSLRSRLIAVKTVAAGETVGYGASWRCPADTRLGVVAIGYGDGYPRYAKAGTPVLVNGERVPLVGRVSMDMITVDLGADTTAKPGDAVTLWGDGLPVEEIAQWAQTIPYTLVCGITPRVQIREE
jgi:alanine racemase